MEENILEMAEPVNKNVDGGLSGPICLEMRI